jgi:hypothetical protein
VLLASQRIGAVLVPDVWQVRTKGPQIIELKAVSIPGCCPPKIGYSLRCSSTTVKLNRGVDLKTLWRLSPVNGTVDTYEIIPAQLSGCTSVSYLLGIEPKTAGSTSSSSCRHSASLVQHGWNAAKDRKKKPAQPPAKMVWKFTRVKAVPPSPSPKRPPSRPALPPTVLEKTRVVAVTFITQPNGLSCSALSQEELKNITQTLCIQQMNYTLSQGWPRNQTTCVGTARCGGARQSNGTGASEHTTDLSLIHSSAQDQTAEGVATSLTEAMNKPQTFYGADFPPNTNVNVSDSIVIPPGGQPSSPSLSPSPTPSSPSPSPIPAPITVPSPTPTPTPTPTPSGGGSPPITVPGVPTATVFTVNTGGAVNAAWTAPVSTGGATVTYDILCTPNTGAAATATAISATSYSMTGLIPGGTYSCSVRSTNSAGSSAYSTAVTGLVPITVPGVPTATVFTVNTGGAVNAAWTAPVSTGGATVTYDIQCTINSGASPPLITGISTTTYAITGFTLGATYACSVRSTNSAGSSAYSTAVNCLVPITVPGVPTATVFTVNTGGTVNAAWTAPVSTGGATVTYGIQCTINSGASPPLITGISTTTYAITGLTPGATYACSVKSTNSAGSSAYSTAVTGLVIPPTVPNAPTSVVLTSNTGALGSINVAWTAAFDGGSAIASYDILCTINVAGRRLLAVPSSTTFTGAAFVCVGSACISTGLTGLAAGSSYACTVRAVNSVGPSSYSIASSPYVIATIPGPPTSAYFDSYNAVPVVGLGWTAPTFTGYSVINAYNIMCTATVSGSQVSASNVVFSCTSGGCIGYIRGLAASIDYTCQIQAVNTAGYRSVYSGASDSFTIFL